VRAILSVPVRRKREGLTVKIKKYAGFGDLVKVSGLLLPWFE
jgi:hypothetical protein